MNANTTLGGEADAFGESLTAVKESCKSIFFNCYSYYCFQILKTAAFQLENNQSWNTSLLLECQNNTFFFFFLIE